MVVVFIACVCKRLISGKKLRLMLEELAVREKGCSFIMDFVGKENKVMMQALGKLGFIFSDMITYYRKIRK